MLVTGGYRCALRRSWRSRTRELAVAAFVAISGFALLVPSLASAEFRRPFVRSINGTGPEGSTVPFGEPGGVSVDGSDNLWVIDITSPGKLDEFNSAGAFIGPQPGPAPLELKENLTQPESLAIENSTGHFYVTGDHTREAFPSQLEVFDSTGSLLRRSGAFARAHVAVDDSTDPFDLSAGSVYVAHSITDPEPPFGDGSPQGIEKFDASGKPVAFSGSASYINGSEITGIPGESFGSGGHEAPGSITVDKEGNVYAVDADYNAKRPDKPGGAIVEFSSEGLFVRAFTGEENPGLGEVHEGWGTAPASLTGVAVDPVSGDVLVSITAGNGVGAVDEFDSTGHFLKQITETSGGAVLNSALAMTIDSSGNLYVVDGLKRSVEVYGPGHFLPSLRIAEPEERTQTAAVLSGSVNPEGRSVTECYFEYVDEAHYDTKAEDPYGAGGTASCEPEASVIPVDANFHTVQAKLVGLVSGTTYRYRLVARTGGTLGGLADSPGLAFTTPHAPVVKSTSANNISSVFADLRAQLEPFGATTSYRFEYVDGAHFDPEAEDPYSGGSVVPAAESDIGSGGLTGGLTVSILQQVGGLEPGTVYHFRIVAKNDFGTTFGPDVTFTTLPYAASGLPDGRGYELVTPPNKGSAEDMFAQRETEPNWFKNIDVGYPSDPGDEFLLETRAAFGSFAASGKNAYVLRRTEAGWQALSLASRGLGVQSVSPDVFSTSGFSQVGILDGEGSVPSSEGTHHLNLVGPPGGPYTTIHSDATVAVTTRIVGASNDLAHMIVESEDHALVAADEKQDPGSHALYEWAKGAFTLVNLTNTGALFRCGATLGQGSVPGSRHNAVSADGSKVIFTAPDPYAANLGPGCWNGGSENVPQLYMRSGGATIELSLAEAGVSDPTGLHPAVYVGASKDGSRLFFITDTELTKDAMELKLHGPELYECEIIEEAAKQKCKLTRVSAGESGAATGEVDTVPAISAEGSVVYFTAFGQLAAVAPSTEGKEKEVNLYRYDTETRTTVYVATVDTRDYPTSATDAWWPPDISREPALATNASWYTTPDGRYLSFATSKELTGFSTEEAGVSDCPVYDVQDSRQFGHCSEVYRYDAAKASIQCVSCDPSGALPVSDAFFAHGAGPEVAGGDPVRAMSDDGSYVFFDTADPLVPQDSNGTNDIYEWEAQGTGACGLASGCVRLISSGQNPAPSFFLGASTDGANVFFGTHARLVPQDTDNAGDLYDARIDGGFPVQAGTGPCEGDACANPLPAPIDASPGSLTFSGAGNTVHGAKPSVVPKKNTTARKLTRALKLCKKKIHRKECETRAHKRYGRRNNSKSAQARHVRQSGRTGR